jgi:hypothetical protein
MKRNKIYIILGVAAAAALYFLSKGSAAKKLQVYFKDIQIGEIKGLKIPDIYARFSISNPSNNKLTIDGISGQIFLNGNLFTTVSNFEKMTILPNTNTFYTVKLVTPSISAFYAVYNLIKKKQSAEIEFKGSINTMGIVLPIDESVNIKLWNK